MENRTHILNELSETAPFLMKATFEMPNHVPFGYFEKLPTIILALARQQESDYLPFVLATASKANIQWVPEGYFDNLSNEIKSKIGLPSADETLLARASKENVYYLPVGYFETLAENVLGKIKNETYRVNRTEEDSYSVPEGYFDELPSKILARINQEQEQSVPAGYFESFPEVVMSKIKEQEVQNELEGIAPILNTISKKPLHFVPEGYFENLSAEPSKQEEVQTKVLSIKKKSTWLTYVAAACILAVIAFTALKLNNQSNSHTPDLANTVIPVVDTTIKINEALAKVDDATIEDYLHKNELVADAFILNGHPVKDEDIQSFLKEFSDEELQQYLQNEGEISTTNNN